MKAEEKVSLELSKKTETPAKVLFRRKSKLGLEVSSPREN